MRVGRRFHRIARDFHIVLTLLHLIAAITLFVLGRFRWLFFHIIAALIDGGAVRVHARLAKKGSS